MEKEDFLYSEKDFFNGNFKLFFSRREFNIYKDKIVILIHTFRSSPYSSVNINTFFQKNIKDIQVKKVFFGFSYTVFLKLDKKSYYDGTPFSSDLVLVADRLDLFNATNLQKVLIDLMNKNLVAGFGHNYEESIFYKRDLEKEHVFMFFTRYDIKLVVFLIVMVIFIYVLLSYFPPIFLFSVVPISIIFRRFL